MAYSQPYITALLDKANSVLSCLDLVVEIDKDNSGSSELKEPADKLYASIKAVEFGLGLSKSDETFNELVGNLNKLVEDFHFPCSGEIDDSYIQIGTTPVFPNQRYFLILSQSDFDSDHVTYKNPELAENTNYLLFLNGVRFLLPGIDFNYLPGGGFDLTLPGYTVGPDDKIILFGNAYPGDTIVTPGGGGNQNLQQVTDRGNTTTRSITAANLTGNNTGDETLSSIISKIGTTDNLPEGVNHLYYSDTRVGTYGDSRYYPLVSNPASYLTRSSADGLYTPISGSSNYIQNNTVGGNQAAQFRISQNSQIVTVGLQAGLFLKATNVDLSSSFTTPLQVNSVDSFITTTVPNTYYSTGANITANIGAGNTQNWGVKSDNHPSWRGVSILNVALAGATGTIAKAAGVYVSYGHNAMNITEMIGIDNTPSSAGSGSFTSLVGYRMAQVHFGASGAAFFNTGNDSDVFPGLAGKFYGYYNNTSDPNVMGSGATLINQVTDNGIDKLQITGSILSTGLDKYATDLSSSYTSRTKIDKGYADATYALIGSTGAGTVTSLTDSTANGVAITWATRTTTPVPTVVLGAITPSSIVSSGNISGLNLTGTNTGDQTTITGNSGTTTKLLTARTINGQSFDGTSNITIPGSAITSIPNASLTNSSFSITTGTTGTDFNVVASPVSLGGTVQLNIPTASVTNRGLLSSTDWSTFNGKQSALSLVLGNTGTDFNGNITSGILTLNIPDASATARGLVTTGAQTIVGVKTLSPVTNTGVSQTGTTFNLSSTATANNGVFSTALFNAPSVSVGSFTGNLGYAVNIQGQSLFNGQLNGTVAAFSTQLTTPTIGGINGGVINFGNSSGSFARFNSSTTTDGEMMIGTITSIGARVLSGGIMPAIGGFARGMATNATLRPSLNGDTLIGIDVLPIYETGSTAIQSIPAVVYSGTATATATGSTLNPTGGTGTGFRISVNYTTGGTSFSSVTLVRGGSQYVNGDILTVTVNGLTATYTVSSANIGLTGITSIGIRSNGDISFGSYTPSTASLFDIPLFRNQTTGVITQGSYNNERLLFNQGTFAAAVFNTILETTGIGGTGTGSLTLPASYLTQYKQIRLTARGAYGSQTVTSPTLTVRVYIGGVMIASGVANAFFLGATNNTFNINLDIEVMTIGTSGTVYAQGLFNYNGTGNTNFNSTSLDLGGSAATINTTINNAITMTYQWGTAATANTIQTKVLTIESLN